MATEFQGLDVRCSMIHSMHGDILKQEAQAVVNTVNCMGVMGRGIALQFRRAFEDNYQVYRKAALKGEIQPGRVFVFERPLFDIPRWIINFPTKRHWKSPSRLEDIKSGLVDLVRVIEERQIRSIAIPPLGCGLGGLNWGEVRPLIEAALAPLPDLEVYLFEPVGAPEARSMVNRTERPGLTPANAAILGLMNQYLAGFMDFEVTLLELHKLLYFLQFRGEKTLHLRFGKGPFGPYANNLRHVLNKLESHYIYGYGEGGDSPEKVIQLAEGAVEQALDVLSQNEETQARFAQVSQLIEGFESSYGLELLATVHWVSTREGATNLDEAVAKVHGWNSRKQQFTPYQIQAAWQRLETLGWLQTETCHAHEHE